MRRLVTYTAAVCAMLVGFISWRSISPGEERNRALLEHLPESNPVRMEESRRRNALIMDRLKDAAETDNNIAQFYSSQK